MCIQNIDRSRHKTSMNFPYTLSLLITKVWNPKYLLQIPKVHLQCPMSSNPQSTKVIVFNYVSHGSLEMAHIANGMANTLSKVEIARGCFSRCSFVWWELLAKRRCKDFDNIEAYFYLVEAKVEIVKTTTIANLLPFLLTGNCATNNSIQTKMLYPCYILSHKSPQNTSSCESNARTYPCSYQPY